ncbi:helix-turn-helix transcriptional regulator [Mycobacterium sp.]|uniref:helix-turn-helix transcriptional regulator n=1 Tax=Mycobacterium sp. TaxID=1785 RepID=UPI003D6BA03D
MTATTDTDGDRLIGLVEAGKRLGLSRWVVRDRIDAGLLPAYRTGPKSALRVRVRDVDALLTRVTPESVGTHCGSPLKQVMPPGCVFGLDAHCPAAPPPTTPE